MSRTDWVTFIAQSQHPVHSLVHATTVRIGSFVKVIIPPTVNAGSTPAVSSKGKTTDFVPSRYTYPMNLLYGSN